MRPLSKSSETDCFCKKTDLPPRKGLVFAVNRFYRTPVRCADAIKTIAAELDVFSLVADADGNYAIRLPTGGVMRLLVRSGERMIFEAALLPRLQETVRTAEMLLRILRENMVRALVGATTLTYLKDLDELALSQSLFLEEYEEESLGVVFRGFLDEVDSWGEWFQLALHFENELPSNPHNESK